jgi:O-acetyl-ADP-ribose deacetylase (regulator of RNase III)
VISVRLADLAEVRAAGILRPASAEWQAVTPAMRRLEIAAGPTLDEHLARLGELPVGSAAITPAGDLTTPFLVHGIVRSYDEPVSPAGVRRAIQNGLRRADEWGLETLAAAPFGTGAGNLDVDEAARIMIEVLLEHMQTARFPHTVEIVVDSDYERDAFDRALAANALPLLHDPADPRDGAQRDTAS